MLPNSIFLGFQVQPQTNIVFALAKASALPKEIFMRAKASALLKDIFTRATASVLRIAGVLSWLNTVKKIRVFLVFRCKKIVLNKFVLKIKNNPVICSNV
jgi:hypothetical protein